MKTVKNILPIYFLALIFTTCESDDVVPPAVTGSVYGVVLNAEDYSSIWDAEVTIGSRTTTAVNGSFELSDVPPGTAVIKVDQLGFEPYSELIQVHKGWNKYDILLECSWICSGRN
jgi:hypothetical protein